METLLIVDDTEDWIEVCSDILTEHGYKVLSAPNVDRALEILEKNVVDLVLTDLSMPGKDGIQLIRKIGEADLGCAVILLTAFPSIESAIDTLKSGALDYLVKPVTPEQLLAAVKNALDRSALRRENQFLKNRLATVQASEEILGKSPKILQLIEDLTRAAKMDTSVLILGESGSGKELAARFLHQKSNRSAKHFVPINCAAIPADLLESELFGHEVGAFTGASQARIGLFENADKGTVFLDEIGEMPLALQAKLLRVLEERKVRRVGSNKERSIDVRLLFATHRNLLELVKEGKFREDLYFRLNVITIRIPPMRERKEDILLLLQHFLKTHETRAYPAPKEIDADVKQALLDYHWPGNVREISNLAQFFIFANRGGSIHQDQLPAHLAAGKNPGASRKAGEVGFDSSFFGLPFSEAKSKLDEDFEKAYFTRLLSMYDWNISQTADKAGIDRRTIHRIVKKLDLKRPD